MRFRKERDALRMELDPFHLQYILAITLQRGPRSVKNDVAVFHDQRVNRQPTQIPALV